MNHIPTAAENTDCAIEETIRAGAKKMLANGACPMLRRIENGALKLPITIEPPNAITNRMNATAK